MGSSGNVSETLKVAAQVLVRSFFVGTAVLLFWWLMLLLAGDLVYRVHSSFFSMSREQFDLIHYGGILMTKTAIFVLFLCPYVGIRLVVKKRGG